MIKVHLSSYLNLPSGLSLRFRFYIFERFMSQILIWNEPEKSTSKFFAIIGKNVGTKVVSPFFFVDVEAFNV